MIKIKELVIYPTSKCNLSCNHCYVKKGDYELSIEDLRWINKVFDARKTIIMGGEPLLYQHLEYMLQTFPNVTISTNSTFIEKKMDLLKKYGDKLTMQMCLAQDTLIQLSTGEIRRVDKKRINNVIGYNFDKMEYQTAKCSRYIKRKEKEILRIKTRTNEILITGEHKFPIITRDGTYIEKKASELTKNDYLLTPRKIYFNGKKQKLPKPIENSHFNSINVSIPVFTDNGFCQFLGYMIGDGLNTQKKRGHISMYDKNKDIILKYKEIGERLFNKKATVRKINGQNTYELCFSSIILRDFFAQFDIKKSGERRVPKIIFRVSTSELGRFLAGYYDAEGCITKTESTVSSASYDLIREINMLLRRFGIIGSVTKKTRKFGSGKGYIYYLLNISSNESISLFYSNIGRYMLHPDKREKIEMLSKNCNNSYFYECYPVDGLVKNIFKILNLSTDYCNFKKTVTIKRLMKSLEYLDEKIKRREIPVYIREIGEQLGMTQQHISYLIGNKIKDRLEFGKIKDSLYKIDDEKIREKIGKTIYEITEEKIENAMKKMKYLKNVVDSFYFDKIIEIKEEKYEGDVYDISIPDTKNFIANNILTHNSIEGGRDETNRVRGEMIWEICLRMAKVLKEDNIGFYFRASYHQDNVELIKREVLPLAQRFGVGVMLLPRVDLPPLNSREQVMFFKEVIQHKNCAVYQPQFFQFIEKNGRCVAGSERISVYFDKRITPCNFDLSYVLGKVGDVEQKIRQSINIFLENYKIPPSECSSCSHTDICKGGCYISKSYIGCPLQHNWGLDTVIIHEKWDSKIVREDMDLLTDYVQKLGIC